MRATVVALGFFLCFSFGLNIEADAAWVYNTIADAGSVGEYGSIAIDSADTPHVAWYDATNVQLMYAYFDFDLGWVQAVVDNNGSVGQWTSIAINPVTDLPAIAYRDQGNDYAMYIYYDGENWNKETIANGGDDEYGEFIRLAFTGSGQAYVSYQRYDPDWTDDNAMVIAWRTGAASWSHYELQTSSNMLGEQIGLYTSIAIDSLGYPQVAYKYEWGLTHRQLYGWLDAGGWNHEDTVTLDSGGEWADIALDGGDNPYISFWDYSTLEEECASVVIKELGVWRKETVECNEDDENFGKYTSIAVDSQEQPHVTYYGDEALNYAVRVADDLGDVSWVLEMVDGANNTGMHTCIALDSEDLPYIVYYDGTLKDFKIAYELPEPVIDGADPDEALNTEPATDITISGNYFTNNSTASLLYEDGETEIPCTNPTPVSRYELICDFDITGATPGLWDIKVTNLVGDGTLADGFTVGTLAPTLTAVNPDSGANDEAAYVVTVTGEHFTPTMSATLFKIGQTPVPADNVTYASQTQASATFDLRDLAAGNWSLTVTTDYGTDTLTGAFEVTCAAPQANFSGVPRTGKAPLTVQFLDSSQTTNSCDITAYDWDFGDGNTDNESSPRHIYQDAGSYTVMLTVTAPGGGDVETKTNYITVTPADDDDDDDDVTDDDNDDNDDNDSDDDDDDNDDNDDDEDDDGSDYLPDDDTDDFGGENEDESESACGCQV